MSDDERIATLSSLELILGRRLYQAMEHLDPDQENTAEWEDLSDRQREFYRLCVDAIVEDHVVMAEVLYLVHDDVIGGSAKAAK